MTNKHPRNTNHQLIDLLVSIIIPSVILMKLSGGEQLGAVNALMLALALPFCWGVLEFVRCKKWNIIAIFGLVSVMLTGGIGLLRIDTQWLAVKEAAVPGVLGIALFISARMRHPFIRTLLYNPAAFDVAKVEEQLRARNSHAQFEAALSRATYLFSGTFFFSSAMNYILAKALVKSPTGSAAFNEELGRLSLVSYPAIALPSMILMILLIFFLWRRIHTLTGLTLEEIIVKKTQENKY